MWTSTRGAGSVSCGHGEEVKSFDFLVDAINLRRVVEIAGGG